MSDQELRAELRTTIWNNSYGQLSFGICQYLSDVLLAKYDITPKKTLRSFKSIGEYYITGRGRVFCVAKWEGPEETPKVLNGTHVLVDDKEYEVTAVKMFACSHSPTNPYRLSFGLLVKEVQ